MTHTELEGTRVVAGGEWSRHGASDAVSRSSPNDHCYTQSLWPAGPEILWIDQVHGLWSALIVHYLVLHETVHCRQFRDANVMVTGWDYPRLGGDMEVAAEQFRLALPETTSPPAIAHEAIYAPIVHCGFNAVFEAKGVATGVQKLLMDCRPMPVEDNTPPASEPSGFDWRLWFSDHVVPSSAGVTETDVCSAKASEKDMSKIEPSPAGPRLSTRRGLALFRGVRHAGGGAAISTRKASPWRMIDTRTDRCSGGSSSVEHLFRGWRGDTSSVEDDG